jgi:hypothetical protein
MAEKYSNVVVDMGAVDAREQDRPVQACPMTPPIRIKEILDELSEASQVFEEASNNDETVTNPVVLTTWEDYLPEANEQRLKDAFADLEIASEDLCIKAKETERGALNYVQPIVHGMMPFISNEHDKVAVFAKIQSDVHNFHLRIKKSDTEFASIAGYFNNYRESVDKSFNLFMEKFNRSLDIRHSDSQNLAEHKESVSGKFARRDDITEKHAAIIIELRSEVDRLEKITKNILAVGNRRNEMDWPELARTHQQPDRSTPKAETMVRKSLREHRTDCGHTTKSGPGAPEPDHGIEDTRSNVPLTAKLSVDVTHKEHASHMYDSRPREKEDRSMSRSRSPRRSPRSPNRNLSVYPENQHFISARTLVDLDTNTLEVEEQDRSATITLTRLLPTLPRERPNGIFGEQYYDNMPHERKNFGRCKPLEQAEQARKVIKNHTKERNIHLWLDALEGATTYIQLCKHHMPIGIRFLMQFTCSDHIGQIVQNVDPEHDMKL